MTYRPLLTALARETAPTIAVLAGRLREDPHTIRCALRDMRANELVIRRSTGWHLTDAGRRMADHLHDDVDDGSLNTGDEQVPSSFQTVFDIASRMASLQRAVSGIYPWEMMQSFNLASSLVPRLPALPAFSNAAFLPDLAQNTRAIAALSAAHTVALSPMSKTVSLVAAHALNPVPNTSLAKIAAHAAVFDSTSLAKIAAHAAVFDSTSLGVASVYQRNTNDLQHRLRIFAPSVLPSLASIAHALAAYNLPELDKWRDLIRREGVQDAFLHAGLFPSPSMSTKLVWRVVRAYDHGETRERIQDIIMAYYDADDCAALSDLVDHLVVEPMLALRENKLRQAFAAYRMGLDATPMDTLVPMVEGVLRPVILQVFNHTNPLTNKPFGHKFSHSFIPRILSLAPITRVGTRVGHETLSCVTTYLSDYFYHEYWPGTASATPAPHEFSNRHMTTHGDKLDGSRMESLACFLLLDAIVGIVDGLRALGLVA